MLDSTDWMDESTTRERFNSLIDDYQREMRNSGLLRKFWIMLVFRKYYDVVCTEEKEARRSKKYRDFMLKVLNSRGDKDET